MTYVTDYDGSDLPDGFVSAKRGDALAVPNPHKLSLGPGIYSLSRQWWIQHPDYDWPFHAASKPLYFEVSHRGILPLTSQEHFDRTVRMEEAFDRNGKKIAVIAGQADLTEGTRTDEVAWAVQVESGDTATGASTSEGAAP